MNRGSILANFPGLAAARTPQDVVVFFDDFLGVCQSDTADKSTWLGTDVNDGGSVTCLDGTDAAEDEAGGVLKVATLGTADSGENLQVNGEMFHLDGGYPMYFETRINVADVSNLDMFIGIAQTDAEIFTGGVQNRVGFELSAGTLSFVSEDAGNQKTVNTNITETDDDWIRLAFYWDGTQLHAYVDTDDDGGFDELVCSLVAATTGDYVPQAIMMTPTIEAITGATASAEFMYIDYVLCMQTRYKE